MEDFSVTIRKASRVGSTNTWAWETLEQERPDELLAFLAEAQSQGRGTQGRSWSSPAGAGLYLSVLMPQKYLRLWNLLKQKNGVLTQIAGLAAYNSLKDKFYLPDLRIKPVNDLYVAERKLAGILVESRLLPSGELKGIVVGLGLNLFHAERTILKAYEAACLEDWVDLATINRELLAKQFIEKLLIYYRQLNSGEAHLLKRYEQATLI